MKIDLSRCGLYTPKNNSCIKNIITDDDTVWQGGEVPDYVDIELDCIYRITGLFADTASSGSVVSVFVSTDGVDFSLVYADKGENKNCINVPLDRKAKTVRFYVKYNPSDNNAVIRYIELHGEKTDDVYIKKTLKMPEDFSSSGYKTVFTFEETIAEVKNLIARNLGEKYVSLFELKIKARDCDYFNISQSDNKILIEGNNGVSLCTGLNHYLKYYCFVNIAQVGSNIKMPDSLPAVKGTVHRRTPFKVRYAYNYCTLGYTMAFWNEERWQQELDYLALNGVNVVLDITAMEEVWRRFLSKLGYTHTEIKNFIVGPAYGPWFNMANIYGVGSPVHDSYFEKRTSLARKNHRFMNLMGMSPVLQGYTGMVPIDIKEKIPSAEIIPQGEWNCLPRPAMLKTTGEDYKKLADLFYLCQKETFGDCTHYYAVDPFHEGGSNGDMDPFDVGKTVMESMLKNDPQAVWIIQSWDKNPTEGLIDGIGENKDHALVLDLYAEKRPRWENFLGREFKNTPWAYCMLNNFGGRMGLHGHIDTVAGEVSRAFRESKYMKGIGITPEASLSNPLIFDLFFETAWGEKDPQPIDVGLWLKEYARRRYGSDDENLVSALELLRETVYNSFLGEDGEGAPESVVNARPSFEIRSASSWGTAFIPYDKRKLEEAYEILLKCYDNCKSSPGYIFDLLDIKKQLYSNRAQDMLSELKDLFEKGDCKEFENKAGEFLSFILEIDSFLNNEKTFTLDNWLKESAYWAENTDDFNSMLTRFTARALITTWAGDRRSAETGGLRDYSNKQWSGLTKDLYYKRWKKFFTQKINELKGGESRELNYFEDDVAFVWEFEAEG